VETNTINSNFNVVVTDSCDPYKIALTNTSKYGKNPSLSSFSWSFGDGNTSTNANPGTHTYTNAGSYTVRLIMTDTTACNSPDTITKTVLFNDINVKAAFQVGEICFGDTIHLVNNSTDAQTYIWKIGSDDTSTETTPSYVFDSAGTYNIKLYSFNALSCNKVDSVEKTVTVNPSPTADFIHAPIIPETNVPITFTNRSKGATLYNWDFGDKTGSQEFNPVHFYKKTGEYKVCLIASNKESCSDTICKIVASDVLPLADLPNGFSPNGDGVNDILYVRGAAIESVDLKIFNRWGELIFQTKDVKVGWDGKYKGKPQEMEAYAFVLNVVFIDGTTLYKKGNVTLLR
jgi:gliding motility-associated-like protein